MWLVNIGIASLREFQCAPTAYNQTTTNKAFHSNETSKD